MAKVGDQVAAVRLLAEAMMDGFSPSGHEFSAVVVACTNVGDLEGAQAWLALMAHAGHDVFEDLVLSIVKTSLNQAMEGARGAAEGVGVLEGVGGWLRSLHSAGMMPLSSQMAVEALGFFERLGVRTEADAWANLAYHACMLELDDDDE